ncbi:MAG: DNA polymerase III subunit alpha, partial [Polaromonas sp.]
LIAPGKLTDFCPLYLQPGSTSAVSQYDKNDVEAIGLVKFDFLGLATLTILEIAREFIIRNHPLQKDFRFENLPLDDKRTYALFAEGNTEAVFQFESIGMQRMLKDAKPNRLEDLIAMNALYRPGPMDLIPTYIARKQGKEVPEYPDPRVKPILEETYGIMVYQEQVMQTAQILGGYSLGGADMLRRAMGKKDEKEMAQHREIFRKGAGINGLTLEKADEVFDLMEKFAGYGFNKSHSAAYALLAYQTAWLKVHYPAEFFAANMTVEMDDTDKLKILFGDAQKMGLTFEVPDINRGDYRFEPINAKAVRYGLGAIKGTGQQAIAAIVAARKEGGPFTSLFDFCVRIDRSKMNKRTVEALIKGGAFDSLHLNRAELLASVERAFDFAAATQANANQGGLFDMSDSHAASTQEPPLVEAVMFGIKARLVLEKTAIGFYLSGHLFDEVTDEVRRFAKRPIDDLIDSREPQLLAGIVSDLRVINGNRGKLTIFKLDDKTDSLETSVDENIFNTYRNLLKDDELVIVQGTLQGASERFGRRFKVTQVWDLEAARCRFGKYLRVAVNGTAPDISGLVRDFPPRPDPVDPAASSRGLPVRLSVRRRSATAELHLGEAARFFPTDAALASWTAQAGNGLVKIIYE